MFTLLRGGSCATTNELCQGKWTAAVPAAVAGALSDGLLLDGWPGPPGPPRRRTKRWTALDPQTFFGPHVQPVPRPLSRRARSRSQQVPCEPAAPPTILPSRPPWMALPHLASICSPHTARGALPFPPFSETRCNFPDGGPRWRLGSNRPLRQAHPRILSPPPISHPDPLRPCARTRTRRMLPSPSFWGKQRGRASPRRASLSPLCP